MSFLLEANFILLFICSNELTKLWNLCPDNLEACKGKDREFLPSLGERRFYYLTISLFSFYFYFVFYNFCSNHVSDTYFAEAIEQNERGVEGDECLVADINFGWRALRLLACRTPYFFSHSNTIIKRLSEYLDTMIKKIANDLYAANDHKRLEQVC